MNNVTLPEFDRDECMVVEFIPSEYRQYYQQLNHVAFMTNRAVYFLKGKFVGNPPWDVVRIPLNQIQSVRSRSGLAVGVALAGLFLLPIALLLIACAFQPDVTQTRKVRGGFLFLGGIMAVTSISVIFGVKRRVVEFKSNDRTYFFKSRPLKFEVATENIRKALNALRNPDEHGIAPEDVSRLVIEDQL